MFDFYLFRTCPAVRRLQSISDLASLPLTSTLFYPQLQKENKNISFRPAMVSCPSIIFCRAVFLPRLARYHRSAHFQDIQYVFHSSSAGSLLFLLLINNLLWSNVFDDFIVRPIPFSVHLAPPCPFPPHPTIPMRAPPSAAHFVE